MSDLKYETSSSEEFIVVKEEKEEKIIEQENKYTKLDDDDFPLGISGLANLGNTCYMNSILQCLFNTLIIRNRLYDVEITKDLYDYVIKTLNPDEINNYSIIFGKCQLTVTFQLHKLFNDIWKDQIKHIKPTNFKKIFSHLIANFQNFDQQDAQEALICILDTIHMETATKVDIQYNIFTEKHLLIFKYMEDHNLSDVECCKMESVYPDIWELYSLKKTIDRYNTNSYSLITSTFQNIISSTLQCSECNYHSFNFDPSIILSIQIPTELFVDIKEIDEKISKISNISPEIQQHIRTQLIINQSKNQIISLEQCFSKFVNAEILDEDEKWNCPHCQTKVKAIKKLDIWIPAKTMIIHLKRFDHQQNKIDNVITFPIHDFNINPFMSEYATKLATFTYDLYAITNHIGNMNGGHYYAFVKSLTDNNWYCVNDDDVIKIDESKLISNNAYILFYKLRE
jgi:ubiquitin C-terminal hydrolase